MARLMVVKEWLDDHLIEFFLLGCLQPQYMPPPPGRTAPVATFFGPFFMDKLYWHQPVRASDHHPHFTFDEVKNQVDPSKPNYPYNLLECDVIAMPLNHLPRSGHWSAVVAYPKHRLIVHYDSCQGICQGRWSPEVVARFLDEYAAAFGFDPPHAVDTWTLVQDPSGLQQQHDGSQCGVFTLLFIEAAARGQLLLPASWEQWRAGPANKAQAASVRLQWIRKLLTSGGPAHTITPAGYALLAAATTSDTLASVFAAEMQLRAPLVQAEAEAARARQQAGLPIANTLQFEMRGGVNGSPIYFPSPAAPPPRRPLARPEGAPPEEVDLVSPPSAPPAPPPPPSSRIRREHPTSTPTAAAPSPSSGPAAYNTDDDPGLVDAAPISPTTSTVAYMASPFSNIRLPPRVSPAARRRRRRLLEPAAAEHHEDPGGGGGANPSE